MEIPLSKGFVAQIDEIDAAVISPYKWHIYQNKNRRTRYANACPSRYGRLHMHRLIMAAMIGRPLAKYEIPEHKDGDGLNNRRDNLRLATRTQNKTNQPKYRGCACQYKGVSIQGKSAKRFMARITKGKVTRYLGHFYTAEEARDAYNAAALKTFGEFALLTH